MNAWMSWKPGLKCLKVIGVNKYTRIPCAMAQKRVIMDYTLLHDRVSGHASPDGHTYGSIDLPLDKILAIYVVKGMFKRALI